MAHKHKKASVSKFEDGDGAHWMESKSNKKRPERKASSAGETKKRFKANTVKVKTTVKKTHKTAKIKM